MSRISSREESLFGDALALPPAERGTFLAKACGANIDLLAHLVALVAAHEGPESLTPPNLSPLEMSDDSLAKADEKPGDAIGHFKLLQKIGEGGCGVVWMAEQEEPVRRRVALKVIKLGMDTKAVVARFEAERQALAMMDHSNIAKVHDAGSTDTGRPFFVMELVRGIPITKYCDENHLTPKERLELFIKVCQAIQHAHQKGVIHRDIKPSNILVTVNDGSPTPKVIDFGIAKATQGKLTDATVFTAFEQFIGTPVYMSPEQAEMSSLDIDTRSDIYSLGVLLYELLTGRPPFDPKVFAQAGVDQIRQQIREIEPPRPSARLRTLDDEERTTIARLRNTASSELSVILRGDLDWIVMRCIEKDRTRRYDTANGLVMDIQRYLRHEPVIARPPSTTYLIQKLVRRHRMGVSAAAAIVVVLLLGVVVSTRQAVRATLAEREQNRLRAAETLLRRKAEAQELAARRKAYASDMVALQQALSVENLGRARELLNRQRPGASEIDLRGWEWRYLWQFCQGGQQSILCTKDASISSLAVSADGKWLAVGEQTGGGLSVWNPLTREEIRLPASRGFVRVAFSPRTSLLAIAVDPDSGPERAAHRVLLWDLSRREFLKELAMPGLPGGTLCVGLSFSDDGQMLVTAMNGPKGEIAVWRHDEGTKVASLPAPTGVGGYWSPFDVTRDFKVAAYVFARGVRTIDLTSGRELWTAQPQPGEVFVALAFSPDGKILAAGEGFAGGLIRLFDAESGRELGRLSGHRSFIGHLLFLPDGRTLASASGDRTIRLWDVGERRLIRTLRGHTAEVWKLALLSDRTTLASGCKDGSVYLWDITARHAEDATLVAPKGVGPWRFDADSEAVIAYANRRVLRWRGKNYQEEETLLEIGGVRLSALRGVRPVQFARDLPLLAAGGEDGYFELWDWERRVRVAAFRVHSGPVYPLGFIQQGRRVILGQLGQEGQLSIHEWDVAEQREIRSWKGLATTSRFYSALSPDGTQGIVLGFEGGQSRIDLVTGRETSLNLNLRQPYPPAYSSDSSLFVAPSAYGYARLWGASNLSELATFSGSLLSVNSVAFSPDGRRLATGSTGSEAVRVWDVDGRELVLTLEARGQYFDRTSFSPDGNVLGSANQGTGLLHLWRAPSLQEIEMKEQRALSHQSGK